MKVSSTFYKSAMRDSLSKRIESNPRYSLRAFARALDIDVSDLSKVFSNKKALSIPNAEKITYKLGLDPDEQDLFMMSVFSDHQERGRKKRIPQSFVDNVDRKERPMAKDEFRIIADWYHAAIMELTFTKQIPAEVAVASQVCSQSLGITKTEAKLALERLLELGFIADQNGCFIKTEKNLVMEDRRITDPARRKFLHQALKKADEALEMHPIETRKMTTMTMAIDPDKMEQAKVMIDDFKMKLMKFLESGESKKVYHLSIGLYPIETTKEVEAND